MAVVRFLCGFLAGFFFTFSTISGLDGVIGPGGVLIGLGLGLASLAFLLAVEGS